MPLRSFSLRAILGGIILSTLALGGCSWASDGSEPPATREPLVPPLAEQQLVPASPPAATPPAKTATPRPAPTMLAATPTLPPATPEAAAAIEPVTPDQSRPGAELASTASEQATADVAASLEATAPFTSYEVQAGDTVSDLAGRFGVDAGSLVWNNAGAVGADGSLVPGALLRVPAAPGLLHEVGLDQTLWSIADSYGVDFAAIAALPENQIADIQLLVVGTTILVPGARPPAGNASASQAASGPVTSPIDAEATPLATPTPAIEETPAPTSTPTPIVTATLTPTATATRTATAVPTATATPRPVRTATPLPTPTMTPEPTPSATPPPTSTPEPTQTAVPTPTAAPFARSAPTPLSTPTPQSVPTGTPTAAPLPTRVAATPTPPAGDPPTPRAEALTAGSYASVKADGDCLYLRDKGDLSGKIVACIVTGSIVSVLDGTIEAQGYRWQQVKSGALTGWAADMYLEPSVAPPPPARVAISPPIVLTSASLKAALAASPWPVSTWPTVERIIQCESSGNTNATGPLGHRGLMQVDPKLHGPVPADAAGQLAQGYEVYKKQGWGAWSCY